MPITVITRPYSYNHRGSNQ